MTALERAESIVTRYTPSGHDSLRDAIHRAIIEHSNAELERRREVEARVQNAAQKLSSLIEWLWESGSPRAARMAKQALEVLEGRE